MKPMYLLWTFVSLIWVVGCGNRQAGGVTDIGNSVAGIVLDSLGQPVANARVQLFADSLWDTQTDSVGRYQLAGVPKGKWMLRVDKSSGARLQRLNVDSATHDYFDTLRLLPYFQLKVRLFDAQLEIVGATWRLDAWNGVFVVDSLPQGDLRLCGNEVCRDFHIDNLTAGLSRRIPDLQFHIDSLQVIQYPIDSLPADYLGETFIDLYNQQSEPWKMARRVAISWPDSLVQTALNDFPMLVRLDSTMVDFSGFQSQGQDLQVYDSLGVHLSSWVESWDALHQSAVVWVRVPQIHVGQSSLSLWLVGGDSLASASPSSEVYGAEFDAVYSFAEKSLRDFSGSGHDGTKLIMDASDLKWIGDAWMIGTGAGPIELGRWDPCSANFTASLWVRWDGSNTMHQVLFAKRNAWMPDSVRWEWHLDVFRGGFGVYAFDAEPDTTSLFPNTLTKGEWSHLALVQESGFVRMFVNGNEVGEAQDFYPLAPTDAMLYLGGSDAGESWNGAIDEVRLESVARSESWIRLSAWTQKD